MPNELLQDFSGGIDNTKAPNRLEANQLATANDCWYDKNCIGLRNGMSTVALTTDSGRSVTSITGRVKVINLGGTDYAYFGGIWSAVSGENPKAPMYFSSGTSTTPILHGTGTVTTTSGSAVVTGSGTSWSTHLRAGDFFRVNSRTQIQSILSVDSDTQITLSTTYSTSDAGAAYSVYPAFSYGSADGISFETMNSLIYMSDGIRTPGNWNGTVFNTTTNFPKALFILAFKNYMFAAGTTANPSRIYWSTIKTPETWPGSNFIDVNPDDGQPITGILNDGTSILILKKRAIYRLAGDIFDPSNPTYTLTKFYTPPECTFDSARSWTLFQGRYVLWGGVGLYEYAGANLVSRIPESERLITTFNLATWQNASLGLEGMEGGQQAITFNGKLYMFSIGVAGFGPILNIERNGSYWLWRSGIQPSIWSPFILRSSTSYNNLWAIFHNGSTGNYGLVQLDQSISTENGSPSFTTKVFEYRNQQRFGRAYLHFKKQSSGSINFGYKVDEGTTVNASVDMTLGTGTRVKSPPIVIGRVGQSIQFVIARSTSVLGEDFEVYGIEFDRQELRQ